MDITSEDIVFFPSPGMDTPASLKFSPTGNYLAYLKSTEIGSSKSLFVFDINSGTETLVSDGSDLNISEGSIEEDLTRQRLRQMSQGISRYEWVNGDKIILPTPTAIYFFESVKSSPKKIIDNKEYQLLDPKVSPDGKYISFISEGEIFVMNISNSEINQITNTASQGVTNGLADYIAQEEMQRLSGYFWSPDSLRIAFTQVNTNHIPEYIIQHLASSESKTINKEIHKYPFAGKDNPKVSFGVVDLEGTVAWFDISKYEYLPRFSWLKDGSLILQVQNREQTNLELVHVDKDLATYSVILKEESDYWINITDIFKQLANGKFIWSSERTGFNHLYMYDLSDCSYYQITKGDWHVDSVIGVDEDEKLIYFAANKDSAISKSIYTINFNGESITEISSSNATASAIFDPISKMLAIIESSPEDPPSFSLFDCKENVSLDLHSIILNDDRVENFNLSPPNIITLDSESNDQLYSAIYKPDARKFSPPYPTVLYVYGGPHSQLVTNSYSLTSAMRIQRLRQNGFLVCILDNRGTFRRGIKFEGYLKNNMGDLEVEDQIKGIEHLIDIGLTDPDNIAVYGWSYGGYISLMCLAKAPKLFKSAIAGAPVTSWKYYDTHYTERYMGHPNVNSEEYDKSSVISYVPNIEGKLLLIHGLLDENVHFRHTSILLDSLISNNKNYELLLLPHSRHMPTRMTDRVYMENKVFNFIERTLV